MNDLVNNNRCEGFNLENGGCENQCGCGNLFTNENPSERFGEGCGCGHTEVCFGEDVPCNGFESFNFNGCCQNNNNFCDTRRGIREIGVGIREVRAGICKAEHHDICAAERILKKGVHDEEEGLRHLIQGLEKSCCGTENCLVSEGIREIRQGCREEHKGICDLEKCCNTEALRELQIGASHVEEGWVKVVRGLSCPNRTNHCTGFNSRINRDIQLLREGIAEERKGLRELKECHVRACEVCVANGIRKEEAALCDILRILDEDSCCIHNKCEIRKDIQEIRHGICEQKEGLEDIHRCKLCEGGMEVRNGTCHVEHGLQKLIKDLHC